MKIAIALFATAGLAAGVRADGHLYVTLLPNAPSTGSGGSVTVGLHVLYSGVLAGMGVSNFKFDVVGHANGTLTGNVNEDLFNRSPSNGTPSGANLLDFTGGRPPLAVGGPPWSSEFLGSITFTDNGTATESYFVTLDIIDYVVPLGSLNVYTSASGQESRSSYTSSTGHRHLVHFNRRSFEVVIPAPASAVLLGVAGLAAGRRRR